jgi:hypothetical protein
LIDPDWHVPLRGKPSAYALNVHSRAKLDGVYTYLPNFKVRKKFKKFKVFM